MKIERLVYERFPEYRTEILRLLKLSGKVSFPEIELPDAYYQARLEGVEKYLQDGSAVIFLAVSEAGTCGWIWCHEIDRMGEKRLHIANIAVNPQFRKQGIGSALYSAAENYARETGYQAIDLLVTASNSGAVKLYRDLGFSDERIQMSKKLR